MTSNGWLMYIAVSMVALWVSRSESEDTSVCVCWIWYLGVCDIPIVLRYRGMAPSWLCPSTVWRTIAYIGGATKHWQAAPYGLEGHWLLVAYTLSPVLWDMGWAKEPSFWVSPRAKPPFVNRVLRMVLRCCTAFLVERESRKWLYGGRTPDWSTCWCPTITICVKTRSCT